MEENLEKTVAEGGERSEEEEKKRTMMTLP